MRLIIHKTPLLSIKNGMPKITSTAINYCIILDSEVEISNYNYKLTLPKTTIILDDYKKVLENDFRIKGKLVKEFIIMAVDKDLIKELNQLKFKNKKVSIGKLNSHELINELMIKTPLFYNKDSVNEGLFLLKLKGNIKYYEGVSPHNLIDDARRINESLELIKPLNEFKKNPIFIKLNGGVRATGLKEDLEFIKKHLLIKHYKKDSFFSFDAYGEQGLYSLGELGLLTNELMKLWM